MTIFAPITNTLNQCLPTKKALSRTQATASTVVCGFYGIAGFLSQPNKQTMKKIANENKKILQALEQNEGRTPVTTRSGITLSERANHKGGIDIEVSVKGKSCIANNMDLKNLRDRLAFDQFVACSGLYTVTRQPAYRDWKGINLSGMKLGIANLSQINLSGVNLYEANMINTNLSGANLSGADLRKAILIEANLKYSKMTGVHLHDARLSDADLGGADLSEAYLGCANLGGANLHRAKLYKAVLIETNLNEAKLIDAYLCAADLSKANLYAANLSDANLSGAYLRGACLTKANLSAANLSKANLGNVFLSRTCLRNANLSEANLNEAHFNEANLSYANLSGADLSQARLRNVNLRGANLSNARMESVHLAKANLTDAVLTNTTFSLVLPEEWDDQTLDYYFNHKANYGESLLMTIESINDDFQTIKVATMQQICSELTHKQVDLHLIRDNFMLLMKPKYYKNPTIAQFCENHLIKPAIEHANKHPWLIDESYACDTLLHYIHSCKSFDLVQNNGFFIQLILNSLNTNNPATIAKAQAFYENAYLSTSIMQKVRTHSDFGDRSKGSICWSETDDSNFVLIDKHWLMMLSQNQLTSMLIGKSQVIYKPLYWDHFFLIKLNEKGHLQDMASPSNLEAFFNKHFKIFLEPYLHNKFSNQFSLLLTLLDLGNYHKAFTDALHTGRFTLKLTNLYQQTALAKCFEKVLDIDHHQDRSEGINLSEQHYQDILALYYLDTKTPAKKQAELFFCLATVFVNYASSAIFGTENDSPEAIRYYAYALMKKAEELYTGICGNNFTHRRKRLLGLDGAFTCTSVLFEEMRQSAQQLAPAFLGTLLPPAWH